MVILYTLHDVLSIEILKKLTPTEHRNQFMIKLNIYAIWEFL